MTGRVPGPGNDSDIVRIAVTNSTILPPDGSHRPQNYLMQLSKSASLTQVVRELCQYWGINASEEEYGLRFDSTDEYVTEETKSTISNGTILKLCPSAAVFARDIIQKIQSSEDPLCLKGCIALHSASCDFAVAQSFVEFGGFQVILQFFNSTRTLSSPVVQVQCESSVLASLVELLKHEELALSWDDDAFDANFITKVSGNLACFVVTPSAERNTFEMQRLKHSLVVLDNLCQSPMKLPHVQESVPDRSLLSLLGSTEDPLIHRVVLSLFNALFDSAPRNKRVGMRRTVEELRVRDFIVKHILVKDQSEDMKNQLFRLQCNLLEEAAQLMMTPVEAQDQKALEKIKELRVLAFNPEANKSSSNHHRTREDYKALGFNNTKDPTQDFRSTPPGMLALDLMFHFARNHPAEFSKMTLENAYRLGDANHACPFAEASIRLTQLLCDAFHLTKKSQTNDASRRELDLQPMIFTQEKSMEMVFSITIQHLFKTWREMRATMEDLDKVIDVTKEQLIGGLKSVSSSFDEFKRNLKTYGQVSEIWKEAAKSKGELESKAVKELEEIVYQDIVNLVERHRLTFAVEGTKFVKLKSGSGGLGGGGGKHVVIRLSANHKTLFYGDWHEDSIPPHEKLANKVSVADLKELLIGADLAAHIANGGRDGTRRHRVGGGGSGADVTSHLTMAILSDNGGSIDVLAPDQKTFDYWCDAINTLLRRKMVSNKAKEDIESFLATEMKIRLLDVEGIDLPKEPPALPPPPPPISCRQRQ